VALFLLSGYFLLIKHYSIAPDSSFFLFYKTFNINEKSIWNNNRANNSIVNDNSTTQQQQQKQQESAFNIFFVETSDTQQTFPTKELCSIESAALNNPNANVYVFSLKAIVDLDNSLMLNSKYSNIKWLKLDPLDLFIGTPLLDWWKSAKVLASSFKVAHLSDAARLALLYKHGGFYSDMDTITVRNLLPLSKYASAGIGYLFEDGDSLGNGFLYFKRGHRLLFEAMNEMKNNYQPNVWGFNGPSLFMRLLKQRCTWDGKSMYQLHLRSHSFLELRNRQEYLFEKKNLLLLRLKESNTIGGDDGGGGGGGDTGSLTQSELEKKMEQTIQSLNNNANAIDSSDNKNQTEATATCDIIIYPKDYIYPITYVKQSFRRLFAQQAKIDIETFINSYSIHFYGSLSEQYRLDANGTSIYDFFASKNCPSVYYGLKYNT
jgi:hypothetical protein